MPIASRSLGTKLRELRENYDLSQSQVAAALNIDRSTYSNYELDKTRPSLESLVKLSHIFNVPRDTFLPDDNPEEPVAVRDTLQQGSMDRSLSKEERGMLALYRTLTRAQRGEIKAQMAKMAKTKDE